MFLVAVALYFLLACLVSWLVLFPAGRAVALRALEGAAQRMHATLGQLSRRQQESVASMRQSGSASVRESVSFLRKHYLLCIAGALLLTIPPLIAILASDSMRLPDYEESGYAKNTQIEQLLVGEQLVPPPPLPPMVFATVEVEQQRPMLASASRDWVKLDPEFTQHLLVIFKIMKEQHNYDMVILEGYRSPERQNMLAKMGSNVTNAAAFQSWHQYGLAADCAFLRNGKIVISEKDPWAMRGYQLYGQVAESVRLTWGGRWKMMDFGHIEMRKPNVMKRS